MNKVWFYRSWRHHRGGSNGGNLKVRDCFNHILYSDKLEPVIYFDPNIAWSENQGAHWRDLRYDSEPSWNPQKEDIIFLSGSDWKILPEDQRLSSPIPIVNIAQPRHVRLTDPRNRFLQNKAIRIVKSLNGAQILKEYGVKEPLHVIPDCIDLSKMPATKKDKDIDVLIIGTKQPDLAGAIFSGLETWAKNNDIHVHLQLPPWLPTRNDFLNLLNRAKCAVCIPLSSAKGGEGFYLLPLEAMAMKVVPITSHAIGNVNYCVDGQNCILSTGEIDDYIVKIKSFFTMHHQDINTLLNNGRDTAENHDIKVERNAILNILHEASNTWNRI